MMQRHNETAKRTGARAFPGFSQSHVHNTLRTVMISSTGLDSLPSDLVAMLAVRELKRKSPQCQPGKVVAAYEIKGTGGISGGSLNTIMSNLDNPQPTTDYVKEPQRGQVKLLTTLPDGSYGSFW